MRRSTQCQEFTGFNSTHFGDRAIFLGPGKFFERRAIFFGARQCDHQPHHHQLYHHIEATLYGIITHHFNHNSRTFEAASSQSFMGGNVMNKKTVYSRKEPNVPGQKNQNQPHICNAFSTSQLTSQNMVLDSSHLNSTQLKPC